MKFLPTLSLLGALTMSIAAPAFAQDAETRAADEFALSTAVATASRAWRDAFNAGDATAAAALYEEDAIMVAKPFGTFEGRDAIQAFWQNLIENGYDDIVYTQTTTQVVDQSLNAAQVSAQWRMNKAHGIITNELWVMQPDGTALLREDHFEVAP
ncbi:YybH family protein [Shimia marina]|uniref:SnoaL-like domain protein n=1 Tax=Shimia marina TaxID=321267 RepID=A0A0P1FAC3_9RHOB|nr:nuclear transport factor 2 family protein [Shimia marina]CUH52930.1 SnoaL-like domain protein [Shimia marina]SFD90431.1 conserved hypothetical protein [Shimia marina]